MNISPIQPSERIATLDILRGFALFGILVVNMEGFSQPQLYMLFSGQSLWTDRLSETTRWLVMVFGDGKFYSLFSFLFGLGAYLFISRAESRVDRPYRLFLRRMTVLLSFGLLHALLLWWGDILVMYALGGCLLLAFYRCNPRTITAWIIGITGSVVSLAVLLIAIIVWIDALSPGVMYERNLQFVMYYEALTTEAIHVYQTGSWADIFRQRLHELSIMYSNGLTGFIPVFVMFLAGLLAGKKGWFHHIAAACPVFKKAQLWGLAIGLPLSVLYGYSTFMMDPLAPGIFDMLNVIGLMVGTPALSLFYIASLTLWHHYRPTLVIWMPVAKVGRMALSHYILQTIICTTLFYSFGLGLYGNVAPASLMLLAVVIYLLQLLLSSWWLRHVRFGMLEWVWRRLTYRRWNDAV